MQQNILGSVSRSTVTSVLQGAAEKKKKGKKRAQPLKFGDKVKKKSSGKTLPNTKCSFGSVIAVQQNTMEKCVKHKGNCHKVKICRKSAIHSQKIYAASFFWN